ncbi:RluA family pseudouridine synthase [Mastigocoleus testarum]|uniref:RNA pseudouridylate synthase n=1 Tax=Mastigocoleus testarum BC008 TaxID=371196 RepID=A0A0V7ZNR9_9CYAN|nr:RluA family pseudouridine synthase [Mastigocoleus testarum]KST66211.1 RNA pseudouridine synthase [Mastigocoleus testarum BC008]
MVTLHLLSDFTGSNFQTKEFTTNNSPPKYYYEGHCPQTGELLKLPRTPQAEAIAIGLMQHLDKDEVYSHEGKMYGILLVELPSGEQRILKAFSGLLNGWGVVEGWVPPIPGREEVALDEKFTLVKLEAIKQEIIKLKELPERSQYKQISEGFEQQLQKMSDRHRNCKQERHRKRQEISETLTGEELNTKLQELDEASRQDGIERRQLKRQRDRALKPLKAIIDAANAKIRELKQQRKELSRQLQAKMHAAYNLINFLGKSKTLQELMPSGLPTGTGDCCAPKLLHYAATHSLKPLAMAEFWWGKSSGVDSSISGEKILGQKILGKKTSGKFYGACVERCQPLMGFLLSGLQSRNDVETQSYQNHVSLGECFVNASPQDMLDLSIIYEDEWLIAVNKPPSLLSVPGRYLHNQDSVLSRLNNLLPTAENLTAVHRLDMDTSGILLLAKDLETYRQISKQFQERHVYKVYEAVLAGVITTEEGIIELPLWGNPDNRPYQEINQQYGKPSLTKFKLVKIENKRTRVEFIPLTGRTHQLRVHAADPQGLGISILGDRLYGCNAEVDRLHLHARELYFNHPQIKQKIHLNVETPF